MIIRYKYRYNTLKGLKLCLLFVHISMFKFANNKQLNENKLFNIYKLMYKYSNKF